MVFLILFIFLILVLIGVPIAFALGFISLFYVLINGDFSYLTSLPQRLLVAIDNFSLLAIPFFILLGELMNSGGITSRILNFFRSLLGHTRGGMAYVNIVTSGALSAIIGSANAVAAITSKSIVPEMKKDGYSNEYSSAVSAASAILGPLIPPSIVLIVYGITATVPISDLFLAGVIPGLLVIVFFVIVAYFFSNDNEVTTKQKLPIKKIYLNFVIALPALIIPIFVLGGIIGGFFTATESGALGCLVAFLLGKFLYREITISILPQIIIRTGIATATIFILVATASLFGWVLTIEKVPQMIMQSLLSISNNPIIILLIINLFLLIIGLFIETFAAILITVPMLLPVVVQFGVDPVHFGIILSFNLILGLITPPVGITLFIVSGITKVSINKLCYSLLPYLFVAIIILLVITYIPSISLFLPDLVGKLL